MTTLILRVGLVLTFVLASCENSKSYTLNTETTERIGYLAFSPDGAYLANWYLKTLEIWAINTGELVQRISVPDTPFFTISKSEPYSDSYCLEYLDKRRIRLSYSNGNTTGGWLLWDLQNQRVLQSTIEFSGKCHENTDSESLNNSHKKFTAKLVKSENKTNYGAIKIINQLNQQTRVIVKKEVNSGYSKIKAWLGVFNNQLLVSSYSGGNKDNCYEVIDILQNKSLWKRCGSFFNLIISPDGRSIAIDHIYDDYTRYPGDIQLWDSQTGKLIRTMGYDSSKQIGNENSIFSINLSGILRQWSNQGTLEREVITRSFDHDSFYVFDSALIFTPDQQNILILELCTQCQGSVISLWNLDLKKLWSTRLQDIYGFQPVFSRDKLSVGFKDSYPEITGSDGKVHNVLRLSDGKPTTWIP